MCVNYKCVEHDLAKGIGDGILISYTYLTAETSKFHWITGTFEWTRNKIHSLNLDECPFGNTEKWYEILQKTNMTAEEKSKLKPNEVCKLMLKTSDLEEVCGNLNPDARRGCCLACRNETAS